MPVEAAATAVLSPKAVGETVTKNFSPTRSPYYIITLASAWAMALSSHKDWYGGDEWRWQTIFIVLSVSIGVCLILSLSAKMPQGYKDKDEYAEHIRFVRGASIASASIALVWDSQKVDAVPYFGLIVGLCVVQMVIFYTHAISRARGGEEEITQLNHVQLALMTTILLTAACYCVGQASLSKRYSRFEVAAELLIAFWSICIFKWMGIIKGALVKPAPMSIGERMVGDVNAADSI